MYSALFTGYFVVAHAWLSAVTCFLFALSSLPLQLLCTRQAFHTWTNSVCKARQAGNRSLWQTPPPPLPLTYYPCLEAGLKIDKLILKLSLLLARAHCVPGLFVRVCVCVYLLLFSMRLFTPRSASTPPSGLSDFKALLIWICGCCFCSQQ